MTRVPGINWILVLVTVILVSVQFNAFRAQFYLNLGLILSLRATTATNIADQQRSSSSSIYWLEQAATTVDETDTLWIALGLAYQLVDNQNSAQDAWNNSQTAYSKFIAKGELYQSSQHPHEAIAWYERALVVRPDDRRAQRQLGSLYHSVGRFSEALPYLMASAIALSEDTVVRAQLCDTYRSLNMPASAIALYEDASAATQDTSLLQLCMGKVYWDLADFDSAAEHFQRARTLNANDPANHFWFSLALNRLGRLDMAVVEAEFAVRMAPNQIGYSEHLLNLYLTKNDLVRVREITAHLLRLDPHNVRARAGLEAISGK